MGNYDQKKKFIRTKLTDDLLDNDGALKLQLLNEQGTVIVNKGRKPPEKVYWLWGRPFVLCGRQN